MPTFTQSSGTEARRRAHRVPRALSTTARPAAGVPAAARVAPQARTQCACGGGCPRCQAATAAGPRAHHAEGATPLAGKEQTRDPRTDEQTLADETQPSVLAPTPTAYAGCTTAQSAQVDTARTTARTKATDAAAAMTALKAGTGTAAQTTGLTANFGALTSAQFDTAKGRYTTIAGRLGDAALFACGSAPTQAYCGPPDNWCAGTPCPTTTGISYLCQSSFGTNCAEPNLWSIMLHESGRAAGCCPPDVQPGAAGYPPAAPACLTNVYSYSGFARAI